jgi:hypothetical protein
MSTMIIEPLVNRCIHRSLPNREIFYEVEGIDSLNSRVKTPIDRNTKRDNAIFSELFADR